MNRVTFSQLRSIYETYAYLFACRCTENAYDAIYGRSSRFVATDFNIAGVSQVYEECKSSCG
jgi:hypothetical protein